MASKRKAKKEAKAKIPNQVPVFKPIKQVPIAGTDDGDIYSNLNVSEDSMTFDKIDSDPKDDIYLNEEDKHGDYFEVLEIPDTDPKEAVSARITGPGTPDEHLVTLTEDQFARLVVMHQKALEQRLEDFNFEGYHFNTKYATYIIEHIQSQLKK
jgi:hypothetical protein